MSTEKIKNAKIMIIDDDVGMMDPGEDAGWQQGFKIFQRFCNSDFFVIDQVKDAVVAERFQVNDIAGFNKQQPFHTWNGDSLLCFFLAYQVL